MSLYVRYQPIALGGGGGGGGVTSVGPFGNTPNADGGDISGSVLTLEPADGTHPGGVSITTQTFGGNKTFLGTVITPLLQTHEIQDFSAILAIDVDNRQLTDNVGAAQLTWSTTGLNVPSLTASRLVATDASKNLISQATGNLTDVGTDGITIGSGTGAVVGSGTTISQHVADATHNGYLSSTDWNTFNNSSSQVTEGPSKVLYVNQNQPGGFTPDGSILRPFTKISDAITQIITNADNITYRYQILVAPGVYSDAINLNSTTLYNVCFVSLNAISGIAADSSEVVNINANITSTSNNDNLKNIQFTGMSITGAITGTGASNGTTFGSQGILFSGCALYLTGTGITFTNAGDILFAMCEIRTASGSGNITFTNCNFFEFSYTGCSTGTLSLVTTSGNQPSGFVNTFGISNYTLLYNNTTIDAGSELDYRYVRIGNNSGKTITNNGVIRSFKCIWTATATMASGSTLVSIGDTFVTPVVNSGATVTYPGDDFRHNLTATNQVISTVATGTPPLVVTSTTLVPNLNVATSGTATNATNVATTQVSNNASYFPLMVASSTNSNQPCDLVTGFTFNPSTSTLTATNFAGNATTATTATNATNVATTGSVTTNASFFIPFVAANSSSNQALDLSAGLSYNPGLSILSITSLNVSSLNASQAVVTDGSKNLASLAYATAATATTLAERDSNANLSANNFLAGYTTTATAAGTTTLTVGSTEQQYFTGSTTQIVALPVTSTLVLGQQFNIVNLSSGTVTVNSSGGNLVATVVANSAVTVTVILTSGTTAASWSSVSSSGASGSAVAPTIQKFTSASGTYTTPTNPAPLYIRVRGVAGGGGGAGSGTANGTAAGVGGTTSFGTSLLSAVGGTNGVRGGDGGSGGTASLGGALGSTFTGSQGGSVTAESGAGTITLGDVGGGGGGSIFAGAGAGGSSGSTQTGFAGATNSGGGGGGGYGTANINQASGSGGGGGGAFDAIIPAPLATYSYAIGAAGTAGGAGTGGSAGGAGGSGYIEVTEYYAGNSTGGTPISNQTANTVYAGPASGGAAVPGFRALVNADVAPAAPLSEIAVNTPNGYGSTNNKIRRFQVTPYINNGGSDITYADSATNGGSFTINVGGVYGITYSGDRSSSGSATMGASVNSNQLTTSIGAITASNRLMATNTSGASNFSECCVVARFAANDVIRPHTDAALTETTDLASFRVTRIS